MTEVAILTDGRVIYTCSSCSNLEVAATVFEADKPNGFFLDLLKITGEKYRHHAKTPVPVYFCTKECLVEGIQFGISHMVKPTVPIGIDARKRSPLDRSR